MLHYVFQTVSKRRSKTKIKERGRGNEDGACRGAAGFDDTMVADGIEKLSLLSVSCLNEGDRETQKKREKRENTCGE